jgi:cytochrome c peroxidase
MHNGEMLTLEAVVDFYNRGGIPHELLSPLLKPLGLVADERAALVDFLKSLTGSNVKTLVSDAFAVPIGDPEPRK